MVPQYVIILNLPDIGIELKTLTWYCKAIHETRFQIFNYIKVRQEIFLTDINI
jgi:hypothetical protein